MNVAWDAFQDACPEMTAGPWERTIESSLPDLALPGLSCRLGSPEALHDYTRCRKDFNADMTDLDNRVSNDTRRVIDIAVRLVVEDGLPYRTSRLPPSDGPE